MKKLILFSCILSMFIIMFQAVCGATDRYVINNEFVSDSELSDWTFTQKNSTGIPSVADGKLVLSSETDDGTTRSPYAEKAISIAADKNFVIEYKVDSIPLSCRHYVYMNDTLLLSVADSPTGSFAIVVDRENGVKAFKNGEEITPAVTSFTDEVSKTKFLYQLRNTARGPATFDYIRIYEIPDGFEILNSGSTEPEYIDVDFGPVLGDVSLGDYVTVSDADISTVQKIDTGIYRINFEVSLEPSTTHTLSVNSLAANHGIVIDGSKTFTVRESVKRIKAVFSDNDFSGCTGENFAVSKTINIDMTNEVDVTYPTVYVVAAAYDTEGKMTLLQVYDVEYSTQQIAKTLSLTNSNFYGDMTIEIYAVDNIKSMNRLGNKEVYSISGLTAAIESIPKSGIENELTAQLDIVPKLDNSSIKVVASGEDAGERDVSLIITKGYDKDTETAPVLSYENILYLRQSAFADNLAEFIVKMPDEKAYYDLYLKTEISEENIVPTVSEYLFYSSVVVAEAFETLNTAVWAPQNDGEKSFAEAVSGDEGMIFGINGYSEEICKVALSLRDEQGGFTDNDNILNIFNLAEIIYTKNGGDAEAFLTYINDTFGLNSNVWYIYNNKIDDDVTDRFFEDVLLLELDTIESINDKFNLLVVNYAIGNSKHYTDTAYVIESIGEDVIGLNLTKYNKCNKKKVNTELTGKTFTSFNEFKDTFNMLVKKYPATVNVTASSGSSSTGASSGSGYSETYSSGGISSIAAVQQNKKPTEVFGDVNDVPWAHKAIENLYNAGIISGRGNGNFEPDEKITRAEAAKIICLALNLDMSGEISFDDVSEDLWSYSFIKGVYSAGIMGGTSDTDFAPDEYVTREMMATILYRAIKVKGKKLSADSVEFYDIEQAADYSKEAISALKNVGLVDGVGDGNFMPKKLCTRAEGTKMIYEMIEFLK